MQPVGKAEGDIRVTRWFRFYDDTINDPKVLKLSDKTFRIWVGILCIASKNNGALPSFEDMAILLRMKPEKLQPELEKLINIKLLDHDDDGLRPHNWSGRQYKSDVSTNRVKRFRNGKRNVSETHPDTEADSEAEREGKTALRAASVVNSEKAEDYAFEGKVIRLTREDFDNWTRAFAALDLRAELVARDAWLASDRATPEDRKRWFISTSKYLANRNMEAKSKVQALRPEPQRGIAGII